MGQVVYHTDRYLVMQTAEADGEFMPEGLFQIYSRVTGTVSWVRWPDYDKDKRYIWYKTVDDAKEAIERLETGA